MFIKGKKYYNKRMGRIIEVLENTKETAYIRIIDEKFEEMVQANTLGREHCYNHETFSYGWEEYVPPPPPVIRFLGLRHSPKGTTAQIDYHSKWLEINFDDVFRIEYTLGDDLPKVTRVK